MKIKATLGASPQECSLVRVDDSGAEAPLSGVRRFEAVADIDGIPTIMLEMHVEKVEIGGNAFYVATNPDTGDLVRISGFVTTKGDVVKFRGG